MGYATVLVQKRNKMETVKLNTTIHCSGCVAKLKPHLDGHTAIKSWDVDLSSEGKPLTVHGVGVDAELVSQILAKEGYQVEHRNEHFQKGRKKDTFWADRSKWNRASFNTLNCLIGCSIGDFGMIIFLQVYYPETTMATQMVLAIAAGLATSIALETVLLKAKEGFGWIPAVRTAFGMSFISMIGMEIAMNTTDFAITGGKASFDDPMYWTALLVAMLAGFLAPLPYNYYKLKKFNQACH